MIVQKIKTLQKSKNFYNYIISACHDNLRQTTKSYKSDTIEVVLLVTFYN